MNFGNVTPTAQLDAFNFLMREIWLHTIAKLIKQRRWNTLKSILETHFAVKVGHSIEMVGYGHFFESLQLVDIEYNNEQETRRISVTADLLEARSADSGIDFYELVEADFLLWIRSLIPPSASNMASRELWWFPNTLARFAEHPSPTPFPLAVRWQVGQQQEALIALFGVPSRTSLLGRLATDDVKSSIAKCRFNGWPVNVLGFLGLSDLASRRA